MGRGYDRLAGVYEGLELLTFGPQLWRARTAFIDSLTSSRHILILGEGDGRFLSDLLALNPHARIDCLDLSRAMLAKAARRSGHPSRVRFIRADATDYRVLGRYLARDYDAVVTLFFLDNFTADTLRRLVPTLAARLRPGGVWLQSDFRLPERGWRRWRARVWLGVMYAFFRWQAGIEADEMVDVTGWLEQAGGGLEHTRYFSAGLLYAQRWRFPAASSSPRDLSPRDVPR